MCSLHPFCTIMKGLKGQTIYHNSSCGVRLAIVSSQDYSGQDGLLFIAVKTLHYIKLPTSSDV